MVLLKPKGLPMAATQLPMAVLSELPNGKNGNSSFCSILINATIKKLSKVAKVGEFYVKEKFSCETPFSISVCLVYLNFDLTLNKIVFLENLEIF
jgi:hypothetical protein